MPTAIFSRLRYGMRGFSSENDPFTLRDGWVFVLNMPVPRRERGDASISLSGLGGDE